MRELVFCPNCYACIPIDAAICPHCHTSLSDWQEKTYADCLIDALQHPLSEVRMRDHRAWMEGRARGRKASRRLRTEAPDRRDRRSGDCQ